MIRFITFLFLLHCHTVFGQVIKGTLLNADSKKAIEYVNIGIVGKNIGTVSDLNGRFNLLVDSKYANDTILFSVIGYKPLLMKVADLKIDIDNDILLVEKTYEMAEVIVKPKIYKERTLGIKTKFKGIAAGFEDNMLGYECGVLMKNKKTAFIKNVYINISTCSYDTIFYRLNIYKVHDKSNFENILTEPIYLEISKESVKDKIQIDLQSRDIVVEGDFLVTLEHVKDLGKGGLYFCAGLKGKTYYRKTSQGKWETLPIGVSISVLVETEK